MLRGLSRQLLLALLVSDDLLGERRISAVAPHQEPSRLATRQPSSTTWEQHAQFDHHVDISHRRIALAAAREFEVNVQP